MRWFGNTKRIMQFGTGMVVNWLIHAATEERTNKKKDAHVFWVNNSVNTDKPTLAGKTQWV